MPSTSASAGTMTVSRGKAGDGRRTGCVGGTWQRGAGGGCCRARLPPAQLQAVGWHRLPTGLEDVSTYPALVAELLARNWTEAEVKAALAENLIRVFRKVEEVSGARQHWAQGGMGHGDTWGMGTHGAWGHTGQQRPAGHQDAWHSVMCGDVRWHSDTRGRGTKEDMGTCRPWEWRHGDIQGDRGLYGARGLPLAAGAHPVPHRR